MQTQKKNVTEFNQDVKLNEGYRYTTNAPFSSKVANKRITEATLKYIPKYAKTIIDIGCGDGIYTNDLKSELTDRQFTGFDPASEAINIAVKKYENIDFIIGDLLNKETFPNKLFDVGIIRGVLHHLPNAQLGIANSAYLSDSIIIIEPNGNNPILKYIERTSKYHIEHEEQSFKSSDLKNWCEISGFEVNKIEFIGFVPFFFPTILSRIIYFFQPILEKIPLLGKYFGAQVVLFCKKK